MDENTVEDPPPKPNDLAGWRQSVADGTFAQFPPEAIVAAIQDHRGTMDKPVLHALAKHLSDLILHILRGAVSPHKPNRGEDIIDRVNAQLWKAILDPASTDGKGLRQAFAARLKFRLKDAIAVEAKSFRIPADSIKSDTDGSSKAPKKSNVEELTDDLEVPEKFDSSRFMYESIYVESILEYITDDRKRLAFRLYMDGVPYKSKKSNSIAKALDISEKTARDWIAEVRELLKEKMGDQK